MNEKEAREILSGSPIGRTGDYCKAAGYLERERALAIKESACVQCTPGGRTVVKNFLCAYHKTVKFLSGKPVKFHINKFTP